MGTLEKVGDRVNKVEKTLNTKHEIEDKREYDIMSKVYLKHH